MSPAVTDIQQRALQCLAEGKTKAQTCAELDISLAQLQAWCAEPEFTTELRHTRHEAVEDSVSALLSELQQPPKVVVARPSPSAITSALTYGEAAEAVSLANVTRAIVTTLNQFACTKWRRSAVLVPRKHELVSVGAAGPGVNPDLAATVPLWKESTFLESIKKMRMFRGPLAREQAHAELVGALGGLRKWPVESFVYPLGSTTKCYALLYADRLDEDAPHADAGELVRLCEIAAVRVRDLVAARKAFAR